MKGRGIRTRRAVAAAVTALLATAGLTAVGVPAASAAAIVADQPLSAVASPMWQTNNSVYALDVANNVVYAGGDFTRVRPPGAARGSNETVRNRLAAFDATTGALITSFNPNVNGRVLDVDVSSDGTKLYLVGAFTAVSGQPRSHVARLDLPGGTLDTSWTADANSTVATVTSNTTAVYVGGDFTTIKGVNRTRIARLSPTTGNVVTSFNASSDGRISESALAPDGSRLLVGGENGIVDGQNQPAIASLDPNTGSLRQWQATGIVPRKSNGDGCDARVTDIVTSGTVAYVTAEGTQAGCWEGVYSADISDGSVNFNYECLGGSMSLALVNGWLYRGSHNHDCAKNPGGYTGQTSNINIWHRLQVHRITDGRLGHWSPNTNGGSTGTETTVGPLVMATDGTQVFVGGDESEVNGIGQQGLTRFGPGGANSLPETPAPPVATPSAKGAVTVTVQGVSDDDDGVLSYRLYRNGGPNPIARFKAESWPWSKPTIRFVDKNRKPGSPVLYQVVVNDGKVSSPRSPATPFVIVPAANPKTYQATLRAAARPAVYWRLHGTGTTQSDSSGSGRTGTVIGGVATGQPGALTGNRAVTTNGTNGFVRSTAAFTPPATFTQSVWFKTTTQVGGTIMGFSNMPSGAGSRDNRVLWMDNDGKIGFGIRRGNPSNPSSTFIRSGFTYNDGRWHQAVVTFNGTALALYLDGVPSASMGVTNVVDAGSGYLRLGYTDLSRFYAVFGGNFDGQKVPLSYFFAGSIDEAAVQPAALSAAQVSTLWASGAAVLVP